MSDACQMQLKSYYEHSMFASVICVTLKSFSLFACEAQILPVLMLASLHHRCTRTEKLPAVQSTLPVLQALLLVSVPEGLQLVATCIGSSSHGSCGGGGSTYHLQASIRWYVPTCLCRINHYEAISRMGS